MITLAQHLAAHQYTDTCDGWESCDCGWREEQERRSESGSVFTHAEHVAATWQQARTITTIDQLDALPVETVVRELSRDGFVLEKYWDQVWDEARWLYPGDDDPQQFPSLPAIVL